MKVYSSFKQYVDPVYWAIRRGVPTGSEASRIITAKKMEYSTAAKGYIHQLLGDRLDAEYPRVTDGNAAMRRGTLMEPVSRRWYEYDAGTRVQEVGFVVSDCGRFGFSPDGLCLPGGVECKNPNSQTHVEWMLGDVCPSDHLAQCHFPLAVCSELEWWDFVSCCPGAPTVRVRVYRDSFTAKLKEHLERFWIEYEAARQVVEAKAGRKLPPFLHLSRPADGEAQAAA